jgi:hypothetical protein
MELKDGPIRKSNQELKVIIIFLEDHKTIKNLKKKLEFLKMLLKNKSLKILEQRLHLEELEELPELERNSKLQMITIQNHLIKVNSKRQ